MNDHEGKHTGCIRYVWKGIVERNETLIVVGFHERNEMFHVTEFMYHH